MGRFLAGMVLAVMAFLIPARIALMQNRLETDRASELRASEFAIRAETLGYFTENGYIGLALYGGCEVSVERTVYAASALGRDVLVRVKETVSEEEIEEVLSVRGEYFLKEGDRVLCKRRTQRGGV